MKLYGFAMAAMLGLASGCSNYHYKTYAVDKEDPTLEVLDLSDGAADASIIHFDTTRYRDVGIPFHRLLLAISVDGKPLAAAGRHSLLNFSGYQAVRLTPGEHSLEWCWISMNALGTGGGTCGFGVPRLDFAAGKRYLATWSAATSIKGPPQREQMEIMIKTFVIDRDTNEQVYP